MHLYQQLQRDTVADRNYLLAAPAIQRALAAVAATVAPLRAASHAIPPA